MSQASAMPEAAPMTAAQASAGGAFFLVVAEEALVAALTATLAPAGTARIAVEAALTAALAATFAEAVRAELADHPVSTRQGAVDAPDVIVLGVMAVGDRRAK